MGEAAEMKFSCDRPRAAWFNGTPWMEAKVRVSGFVKAAIGVGMME